MIESSSCSIKEKSASQILLRCGSSELWLEGQALEHQFFLGDDRVLLFVSDGQVFESCLMIYLISSDGHILDGIELLGAYADGTLNNVKPISSSSIVFTYFGDQYLVLEILLKAGRFVSTVPGARYLTSVFKKRYLKLSYHVG